MSARVDEQFVDFPPSDRLDELGDFPFESDAESNAEISSPSSSDHLSPLGASVAGADEASEYEYEDESWPTPHADAGTPVMSTPRDLHERAAVEFVNVESSWHRETDE